MQRGIVLALCLVVLTATAAHAEFYRWVDRDGREFFANEREKVPQEYRDRAETVRPDESRVSVAGKPTPTGKPLVVKEHKDKYGRGEDHWRKRAAKLRGELQRLRDDRDLIVKQEKNDDEQPKKLTGKKKKAALTRQKKKAQLEKKIAVAERKLDDLAEEARKADAYPGWLRE